MKASVRLCAVALLSLGILAPPKSEAAAFSKVAQNTESFYFQLVYGSNADAPPTRDAKRIGPKLRKRLEHVFQWKYYWEVNRGEFQVREGKTTEIRISDQRTLEVSLSGNDLEIRIYRDGKLMRRNREKRSVNFTLLGGDDGRQQSWFIIIRRDKPSTAE